MPTKYELVNKRMRGRLRHDLVRRRTRGDSYDSIAFSLSAKYGVQVTGEAVRYWFKNHPDLT